MERMRSFVCLCCGKTIRVDIQTYEEKREEPICDKCIENQASTEVDAGATREGFDDFVGLLDRGLNSIGKIIQRNKTGSEKPHADVSEYDE